MTDIYLTRHGETDWNKQGVFRGRADIELNSTGLRQAEALAEFIRDVKFTGIFCSPLERTLRTAQIAAKPHYRVHVEPLMELVDLDYGEWQGVSKGEVKEKDPDIYDRWQNDPVHTKIPGGEGLNDVKKRAQKFIDSHIKNSEGTLLVVTHRVVVKTLFLLMMGLDISRFQNVKHDPCGVSVFSWDKSGFVLKVHNETCFLKSLQKTGQVVEDF